MTAILEFQSVSKTYTKRRQTVEALKSVSFSIEEGEVFGFVGPNGAGKSTTIKILLDIISDYNGEVRLFGQSARQASSRQHVAYLPEAAALYEQFTPLDILKTALRMYGIKRADELEWCMYWLERFSVAGNAKRKIRQLSKGNVQRVALAHAMVVEPKLLVLDEPLSGLDPVGRKDVVDILQEYKQKGGAIFFTSHVLHDVERIADRFGFINQGRLLTTQSPRDLMAEHAKEFLVRYQSDAITEGQVVRPGEYEVQVSQQDLPEWLGKLNGEQGQLLEVKPLVSLEAVFFKMLEQHG